MSGGTAFPTAGGSDSGMTLRDYFAGKVMQGMLAGMLADGSTLSTDEASIHARIAYLLADAMLEARKS